VQPVRLLNSPGLSRPQVRRRVSLTDVARAQARNLNVGVVAVEDTDSARVVEPARVTGAGEFSTTINAVRLRATTHRLTAGSFPVNHPKNYLGYALALAADGDTDTVHADNVINAISGGRRGAILLNLVDDQPNGDLLTPRRRSRPLRPRPARDCNGCSRQVRRVDR